MLGIAARSSIATPSGRFNQRGASSVMTSAIPKLTGTPISSAIIDVMTVPYSGAKAPNCPVTGFHSLLTRNLNPNVFSAGHAPVISVIKMPKTDNRTRIANSWVSPRKNRSPAERERAPCESEVRGNSGGSPSVSCVAALADVTLSPRLSTSAPSWWQARASHRRRPSDLVASSSRPGRPPQPASGRSPVPLRRRRLASNPSRRSSARRGRYRRLSAHRCTSTKEAPVIGQAPAPG